MGENRHDRDHLHRICKAALSVNKCVTFAAILDPYGKIIVGNCNGSGRNNRSASFMIYRDYLLPVITSMNSYSSYVGAQKGCAEIQYQLLSVGVSNRISIAQFVDEDDKRRYFLAVYWKL
jgi:hypothetical protein